MRFLPEHRYVELLNALSAIPSYKAELQAFMQTPNFDYNIWQEICEKNREVDSQLKKEVEITMEGL